MLLVAGYWLLNLKLGAY